MNVTTVRHKRIKCPHCKRDQRIHLLAVPGNRAVLKVKQMVRCIECQRGFELLNDTEIVDGPFPV